MVTAVGDARASADQIGWAQLVEDEFDEALSQFDVLLENDPNRATAHIGRAITLAMMGRDDEAIVSMRRAVDLGPEWLLEIPDHANLRAIVTHLMDEYRKRANLVRQPADLWFMVGALETTRGEFASASGALLRAVEAGDRQPSTTSLRHFVSQRLQEV